MSEFLCLINEYFSVYLKHVIYQSCLIMTAIIIPDSSYLYLHLNVVGFLHAVAYHFIIGWLCGSMGLDNTRPLPACIYREI